jgi:hypothetical protein
MVMSRYNVVACECLIVPSGDGSNAERTSYCAML